MHEINKPYFLDEIRSGIKNQSISVGFNKYLDHRSMEKLLDVKYSRALIFYRYLANFIVLISIITFFIDGFLSISILGLVAGLFISSANHKSAREFMIEQLVEDDVFFKKVVQDKIVLLKDNKKRQWITNFNFSNKEENAFEFKDRVNKDVQHLVDNLNYWTSKEELEEPTEELNRQAATSKDRKRMIAMISTREKTPEKIYQEIKKNI